MHHLDTSSEDDEDEYAHWVNAVKSKKKQRKDAKCLMLLDKQEIIFQIDTGATINTLPAKFANEIKPYKGVLTMWNKSLMKPLGICRKNVKNPKMGKTYSVEFVVFKDEDDCRSLLGLRTSTQVGLVEIKQQNFYRVAAVNIEKNYREVFDGQLGKLPGVTTLQLKPDTVPAVMSNRRIPVAVRLELQEELNRLTRLGIIEPVKKPTQWVSQLVLTRKKNGALRICLDPHELIKALMREHYIVHILEDILHDMRGAKIFTKADLSSGYWLVELDEASSNLTTFQTCFGRCRWRRLPFGLNSAAEIFQRELVEQFQDMKAIIIIADDLVVYGTNREKHDSLLHNILQKCQTIGVKLNPEKLEIGLDAITFMGHRITKEGIVVGPEKVRARAPRVV